MAKELLVCAPELHISVATGFLSIDNLCFLSPPPPSPNRWSYVVEVAWRYFAVFLFCDCANCWYWLTRTACWLGHSDLGDNRWQLDRPYSYSSMTRARVCVWARECVCAYVSACECACVRACVSLSVMGRGGGGMYVSPNGWRLHLCVQVNLKMVHHCKMVRSAHYEVIKWDPKKFTTLCLLSPAKCQKLTARKRRHRPATVLVSDDDASVEWASLS